MFVFCDSVSVIFDSVFGLFLVLVSLLEFIGSIVTAGLGLSFFCSLVWSLFCLYLQWYSYYQLDYPTAFCHFVVFYLLSIVLLRLFLFIILCMVSWFVLVGEYGCCSRWLFEFFLLCILLWHSSKYIFWLRRRILKFTRCD